MSNKIDIKDILAKVQETAPEGAKVSWEYPGYISVYLSNKTEIAFGESLESDTGYTWNDFNFEGTNKYAGGFDDLGDLDAIVAEFWNQASKAVHSVIAG
jgi:hypothetical protein